ncbi:MAG: MBL fold metallo-hydrolase [Eubacteriales bacterium]|nr:MBL fold metallo-hydrolase [Eubacteriales bacterium]
MVITEPIFAEIAPRTWCINEFGMDALFLLEGDEKALLIDTGTGTFDIPAYLKRLTAKPIVVALTHGHVDHAGGRDQFPEVYAHPDDFGIIEQVSVEARKSYAQVISIMNDGLFAMTPDSVIKCDSKTKLLPLVEGDVIHLGNRDVEVYETPGHTPGGLSFLDRQTRIMISGDACNMNTLLALFNWHGARLAKTDISDLLATARKLESLHDGYDRHYNGHAGFGPFIMFTSQPECLVRDCIELCEGLLDGSIEGVADSSNPFTGPCLLAKHGTLQVLYVPEQVC